MLKKKIDTFIENINHCDKAFICPICKSQLHINNKSLECNYGHCYNISKKGFVVLNEPSSEALYGENLFLSRRNVFSSGYYDNIAEKIISITNKLSFPEAKILDAGCGEGFYTGRIASGISSSICFGIDLSKSAIARATDYNNCIFSVADLSSLPFADSYFDVIVNILTPACYNEFLRVLKPNGVLIKVIPGKNYLKELRNTLSKAYDNDNVLKHAYEAMNIIAQDEISYTLPLNQTNLKDFISMSPLTANLSVKEKELLSQAPINEITIDLIILTCNRK